jgi:hypothetical protein
MLKVKWTCAFLVLGLLVAMQSFAEMPDGNMTGDHMKLAMYYDQQAQDLKAKAENWEFAAEYYEKFPPKTVDGMTASEHIAHCRAIAADFRKAMKDNQALAAKHHALVRLGAGP